MLLAQVAHLDSYASNGANASKSNRDDIIMPHARKSNVTDGYAATRDNANNLLLHTDKFQRLELLRTR